MKRIILVGVVMALLVLAFAVPAFAATSTVSCGQDLDNIVNGDSATTATQFVLQAGCTFTASASLVPKAGDAVVCATPPTYLQRGPAQDPTVQCHVNGPNVDAVFRPRDKVHLEGLEITGGVRVGDNGSGAGLACGRCADTSTFTGLHIHSNEVAGILSGRGTFDAVELSNNTTNPQALGWNGTGAIFRHEVVYKNSYIHNTQANGLWCSNECLDSVHGKFHAHHNLVVNNGRAGIRVETVSTSGGESLIEDNEIHGNANNEPRGGVDIRDASNVLVQNNRFGPVTIAGVSYPRNASGFAVRATDSGKADRPNLFNIDIVNNVLNGEAIKGCELPDSVVFCSGNTR